MLLSNVGASPWYYRWNKVSAPTCLLCASGCMAFLLCPRYNFDSSPLDSIKSA